MQLEQLKELVLTTLDDMKARDVTLMDVRGKTPVTDYMVVASGTSDRHVKAIAETVAYRAKDAGEPPLGTEGVSEGEWALIDLNGVAGSRHAAQGARLLRPGAVVVCPRRGRDAGGGRRPRLSGDGRPCSPGLTDA